METFYLKKVSIVYKVFTFAPQFNKTIVEQAKKNILTRTESLFLKFGFKSITMDDVSRELGISKKTLYQHFVDKNDLVNQCVENHLLDINAVCDSIVYNKELDAIEAMMRITQYMSQMLRNMNPSAMFDLKKYFKSTWDKMEENRRSFIMNGISENFDLGVRKGLYRKDLNKEMIVRLYLHLVSFIIDPDHYDRRDMDITSLHIEIVKYHMRSICTPKGLEILEEKIKHLKK
jgi:AcrR family transcriptional regulator